MAIESLDYLQGTSTSKDQQSLKQLVSKSTYDLISNIYSEENFSDPRLIVSAGVPTDILGYPMMFSDTADPLFKAGSHTYGRVEFNTLVKDMPLIFIQPGKTKYMPGKSMLSEMFGGNSKGEEIYKVLQDLNATRDSDKAMEAIKQIQNKTGMRYDSRYYGFKPAYDEYIKFVSSMSAYLLVRMNLSEADFRVVSTNHTDKWLQKTMIPIYADTSTTRFSESGSNSTADSMVGGMFKTAGGISREIDFLFNGTVNSAVNNAADAIGSNSVLEKLGGLVDDLTGSSVNASVDHILSTAKTVVNGGNLIFPEIWQDSQYSKTYDIGIKLYSPYGDPLSIYNNIYHPLLCLLALALPRQLNKQGYAAPFLLKVFSKGWFSCDMGMVQSITINKGGASGKEWTDDGYPLAVDVTLSIKDLYPTMMQTLGKASDIYAYNTGMLEFLDCLASIEPGDVDYMLRIKTSVFENLMGNTMLQKMNAQFQQSGLSNAIHAVIGTVTEIDDTVQYIANQIKGTINNITDLFTATSSEKSTTENALGQGNYSDIEIDLGN